MCDVHFRNGKLPEVTVKFEVHGVTPSMCSSYGGCDVTITGKGLAVKNIDAYSVKVGRAPCDVKETSENEISCNIDDSARVFDVKNDGFSDGKATLIILL